MSKLRYAAYGSNLHPVRLQNRVPSASLAGTERLPGMSLHFHKQGMDGSAKANVLESGDGVHVAIYTIDAHEKPLLDRHEHAGIGYESTLIDVPGFGECFTYVATETHIADELDPYCWYHELVLVGCRLHGFPDEYIASVETVARIDDPDRERRRRNWRLVEEIRRG